MWHWTGYVSEVLERTFKVVVEDQTVPTNPKEEWEIEIEKLRPDQRPLLCEGRALEVIVGEDLFSLEFVIPEPISEETMKEIEEEAGWIAALLMAD